MGVYQDPPAGSTSTPISIDATSSLVLYAQTVALSGSGTDTPVGFTAGWRDGAPVPAGAVPGGLFAWYTPSTGKKLYLDSVLAQMVSGTPAMNALLKIRSSPVTSPATSPTTILMPIQLAPPAQGAAIINQGEPIVSLAFPRSIRIPNTNTIGLSVSFVASAGAPFQGVINVVLTCHEA